MEDFDSWYEQARASLGPALASWCGDPAVAADALDEAFVRAVERWERVGSLASPTGWVWRTATNVVRRRARRRDLERRLLVRRAHERVEAAASSVGPSGEEIDLRRAVRALPERQRTAIVLFYVADLPVADVAAAMDVATGTVAASLHQARRNLAHLLGDETETGASPETPPEPAPKAAPETDGAAS